LKLVRHVFKNIWNYPRNDFTLEHLTYIHFKCSIEELWRNYNQVFYLVCYSTHQNKCTSGISGHLNWCRAISWFL